MRPGEKITWGAIGLLVAAGIGLLYLLNTWLGLIMTAFAVLVIWAAWIRMKMKVDRMLAGLAKETGLEIVRHPLVYNRLRGTYEDIPVTIDFVGDWGGGVGLPAAWLTGQASLVLTDIRNFTRLQAQLPRDSGQCVVNDNWPALVVNGRRATLMRPGVCRNADELFGLLKRLVKDVKTVTSEGWSAPIRKPRKGKGMAQFWQNLPWYGKMWLVMGGIVLFVGGMIAYDLAQESNVEWQTLASLNTGSTQHIAVPITNAPGGYILVLQPSMESGWGTPPVHLKVDMRTPDGRQLWSIGAEYAFGGEGAAAKNRSFMSYVRKFSFDAEVAGEYEMTVEPVTEHVEEISVKLLRVTE